MQNPYHYAPTRNPLTTDTSSAATTIFVYGILGMVLCQIFAPIAWVKGNEYMTTCSSLGVAPSGLGVAGRILGIIGTILTGISILALTVGLLAAQIH